MQRVASHGPRQGLIELCHHVYCVAVSVVSCPIEHLTCRYSVVTTRSEDQMKRKQITLHAMREQSRLTLPPVTAALARREPERGSECFFHRVNATPIESDDRTTPVFGDYIDVYDILSAKEAPRPVRSRGTGDNEGRPGKDCGGVPRIHEPRKPPRDTDAVRAKPGKQIPECAVCGRHRTAARGILQVGPGEAEGGKLIGYENG